MGSDEAQVPEEAAANDPAASEEELRAKLDEELRRLRVEEVILQSTASIVNLARSARVAPTETARRQLWTLVAATAIAGLAGPVSFLASWLDLFPIPMVVLSTVLAIFVGMVGFGVARYSALVEGRTMTRDFIYNLVMIVLITCFYLLAVRMFVLAYEAPSVMILMISLAFSLTISLPRNPLLLIITRKASPLLSRSLVQISW